MFSDFADKFYAAVAKIPFDYLVWFVWGSYLLIFAASLVLTLTVRKIKSASKRPFLCLTNAYAAVTLALYLLKCELAQSVLMAAMFWVAGYLFYGALCFFSREKQPRRGVTAQTMLSNLPVAAPVAERAQIPVRTDAPAIKSNVRLDHAASVTDKLLSKSLGKSDRQELEKLKNTFSVLQLKGSLSPAEADILNENFNLLLKLMAKYNV